MSTAPAMPDYVKNMITGAAQMDGAILVVSARRRPDAADPASTSSWRARSACRRSGGVPETSATWWTIRNCSSWSKWKSASSCPKYEFPGDDIPIVKGLGFGRPGETRTQNYGHDSILELMKAVDSYIPQPERPIDPARFLMPVEDVFSISGRGTGCDRAGGARRGQGRRGNRDRGACADTPEDHRPPGVEMFRKLLGPGPGRRQTSARFFVAPSARKSSVARCWRSPVR